MLMNIVKYTYLTLKLYSWQVWVLQVWLLIEIVSKGTPFLLSIKTMKSLGATLDLSGNTCFLKTLNWSLSLRDNTNGLFVIGMSDLCQVPEATNEAALTASSIVLTAPPGLTLDPISDHAHAPRCTGGSPIPVGGGVSQPSSAVLHAVFDDIGHPTTGASVRTGNAPDSAVDPRSEEPEQQDHGVEQHHRASSIDPRERELRAQLERRQ